MQDEFQQWLEQQQLQPADQQALAGGDICQTRVLTTADGERLCVKQRSDAPADFFAAEAAGLRALHEPGCIRVPRVWGVGETFIAMEYIPPGRPDRRYWQALGEQLAELHRQPATEFGFEQDNYCGLTPQPNTPDRDGHRFFARCRLQFQGDLARQAGLLSRAERAQLDRFCEHLKDWIPEQPPALIHGDLWSGNIHCSEDGEPVILDPAAHRGWAEAEIAMTTLFGGFAQDFYDAYTAVNPLASGWRERLELYNLYHLLNHLNLFGGAYHGQVVRVLHTVA